MSSLFLVLAVIRIRTVPKRPMRKSCAVIPHINQKFLPLPDKLNGNPALGITERIGYQIVKNLLNQPSVRKKTSLYP